MITENEFLISVNKYHFCAYAHKINYKKINAIEVKGDVKGVEIMQLFRDKYPEVPVNDIMTEQPNDELSINAFPFLVNIPNGFTRNKSIHIIAKVKLLPHSFTINLQQTKYFYPHPLIALHLNPRFNGKHVLCMNTWSCGKWLKENRIDLMTKDLFPGKVFHMKILCDDNCYQIYLNDFLFAEYQFRVDVAFVDTLNIFGDIVLKKVWIEEIKYD
jgi:hypothetical protein